MTAPMPAAALSDLRPLGLCARCPGRLSPLPGAVPPASPGSARGGGKPSRIYEHRFVRWPLDNAAVLRMVASGLTARTCRFCVPRLAGSLGCQTGRARSRVGQEGPLRSSLLPDSGRSQPPGNDTDRGNRPPRQRGPVQEAGIISAARVSEAIDDA